MWYDCLCDSHPKRMIFKHLSSVWQSFLQKEQCSDTSEHSLGNSKQSPDQSLILSLPLDINHLDTCKINQSIQIIDKTNNWEQLKQHSIQLHQRPETLEKKRSIWIVAALDDYLNIIHHVLGHISCITSVTEQQYQMGVWYIDFIETWYCWKAWLTSRPVKWENNKDAI